jgi:K(+)-stimulated pyrophosphate-energized sodium pump
MCDSVGCSAEEKEMCMAHYDADGKFIAPADKNAKVEIKNTNGKAKATVTTTADGKSETQTFEGSLEEVKAKVEGLK